jgi:hypothetical protein
MCGYSLSIRRRLLLFRFLNSLLILRLILRAIFIPIQGLGLGEPLPVSIVKIAEIPLLII